MGNPPLEFIKIQPLKRGSASKIHQHTVPQKGDRLQNSSTYTAIKGGPPLELINQRGSTSRFHHLDPPLEFINVQPQNRGSASRIHQHTAPQKGSASRIHQHTAPQKGVRIQNSSSYSPPKGGPHLEFINIQPPKRGSASRIHQHTVPPPPQKKGGPQLQNPSTKWGSTLESINQRGSASRFYQPKGGPPLISSTKRDSIYQKETIYMGLAQQNCAQQKNSNFRKFFLLITTQPLSVLKIFLL